MKHRHGVREVPVNEPDWRTQRRLLTDMREAIIQNNDSRTPPRDPSNLQVTPLPGGNRVSFTRSDADYYILYYATTRDHSTAVAIDLGGGNEFNHLRGKGTEELFYWVQGFKHNGKSSNLVGPNSGTTLALGTNATLPLPPPSDDAPIKDDTTGRIKLPQD
jgi:hypothetical protein